MTPQASGFGDFFTTTTRRIALPKITLVRPNNVTAYVAGGVLGDAADARLSFTLPAVAPPDAAVPAPNCFGGLGVHFLFVNHRDPAAVALPAISGLLCAGPFTTVLGDQAPMALNDADIDALYVGGAVPAFTIAGMATGVLNLTTLAIGAGAAGRRGNLAAFQPSTGTLWALGQTLGLYLWMQAAYVPIAQEVFDLYPWITYLARYNG
jgi:hypothetical protein